jgi:hypothetical protein
MQGRIDSATEFAAADLALKEVLSTNLPKTPLNKFAKEFLCQVSASTSSRKARATAVREARRSSTAKLNIYFHIIPELLRMSQRES